MEAIMAGEGTGTQNAHIGSKWSSGSLVFYNKSTGASVFTIATTGVSSGVATSYGDDDALSFGDSSDVSLEWDTASTPDTFKMTPAAADTVFEIGDGTAANRMDFKVWAADTTNNILLDASANTFISTGVAFQLKDSANLVLGTGAGVAGDFQIGFDGTRMDIAPQTDDLLIRFGTPAATQKSPDVRFHGNAANGADYLEIDASASQIKQAGAMEYVIGRKSISSTSITAKTTAYSVTATDTGTLFHTTGASATVTFTLPTPVAGLEYEFFNAVNYGMKIAAASANQIITFNDVDADNVYFYTSSEKLGAHVVVRGLSASKWAVTNLGANTMTVTT